MAVDAVATASAAQHDGRHFTTLQWYFCDVVPPVGAVNQALAGQPSVQPIRTLVWCFTAVVASLSLSFSGRQQLAMQLSAESLRVHHPPRLEAALRSPACSSLRPNAAFVPSFSTVPPAANAFLAAGRGPMAARLKAARPAPARMAIRWQSFPTGQASPFANRCWLLVGCDLVCCSLSHLTIIASPFRLPPRGEKSAVAPCRAAAYSRLKDGHHPRPRPCRRDPATAGGDAFIIHCFPSSRCFRASFSATFPCVETVSHLSPRHYLLPSIPRSVLPWPTAWEGEVHPSPLIVFTSTLLPREPQRESQLACPNPPLLSFSFSAILLASYHPPPEVVAASGYSASLLQFTLLRLSLRLPALITLARAILPRSAVSPHLFLVWSVLLAAPGCEAAPISVDTSAATVDPPTNVRRVWMSCALVAVCAAGLKLVASRAAAQTQSARAEICSANVLSPPPSPPPSASACRQFTVRPSLIGPRSPTNRGCFMARGHAARQGDLYEVPVAELLRFDVPEATDSGEVSEWVDRVDTAVRAVEQRGNCCFLLAAPDYGSNTVAAVVVGGGPHVVSGTELAPYGATASASASQVVYAVVRRTHPVCFMNDAAYSDSSSRLQYEARVARGINPISFLPAIDPTGAVCGLYARFMSDVATGCELTAAYGWDYWASQRLASRGRTPTSPQRLPQCQAIVTAGPLRSVLPAGVRPVYSRGRPTGLFYARYRHRGNKFVGVFPSADAASKARADAIARDPALRHAAARQATWDGRRVAAASAAASHASAVSAFSSTGTRLHLSAASASGYRGVTKFKDKAALSAFRAKVGARVLGFFDSAVEAAEAVARHLGPAPSPPPCAPSSSSSQSSAASPPRSLRASPRLAGCALLTLLATADARVLLAPSTSASTSAPSPRLLAPLLILLLLATQLGQEGVRRSTRVASREARVASRVEGVKELAFAAWRTASAAAAYAAVPLAWLVEVAAALTCSAPPCSAPPIGGRAAVLVLLVRCVAPVSGAWAEDYLANGGFPYEAVRFVRSLLHSDAVAGMCGLSRQYGSPCVAACALWVVAKTLSVSVESVIVSLRPSLLLPPPTPPRAVPTCSVAVQTEPAPVAGTHSPDSPCCWEGDEGSNEDERCSEDDVKSGADSSVVSNSDAWSARARDDRLSEPGCCVHSTPQYTPLSDATAAPLVEPPRESEPLTAAVPTTPATPLTAAIAAARAAARGCTPRTGRQTTRSTAYAARRKAEREAGRVLLAVPRASWLALQFVFKVRAKAMASPSAIARERARARRALIAALVASPPRPMVAYDVGYAEGKLWYRSPLGVVSDIHPATCPSEDVLVGQVLYADGSCGKPLQPPDHTGFELCADASGAMCYYDRRLGSAQWHAPEGSMALSSLELPTLAEPFPDLPPEFPEGLGLNALRYTGWHPVFDDINHEVRLFHACTGSVRGAPWIALRTESAQVYFVNLVTRETRWYPPRCWVYGWISHVCDESGADSPFAGTPLERSLLPPSLSRLRVEGGAPYPAVVA